MGVESDVEVQNDEKLPPEVKQIRKTKTRNFKQNIRLRIKTKVSEEESVPSITAIYPCANWYEREAWDMFGITFGGHPNLYRILLPPTWEGHALRKDHPARATEMAPFEMGPERVAREQEALRFRPEEWGMQTATEDHEYMFLNLGPNHPSVHGVFRIALQLDGEGHPAQHRAVGLAQRQRVHGRR